MKRAKYQQGEWTILTITDNGKTIANATPYEAREGYVWVRKDTPDFILGSVIYVAPDDTIENYQQIPEP